MGSKQIARRLVPKEHLQAMEEVFEEFGVTEWQVDQVGKHPRVTFKINGQTRKFPLPSSPSDRRGVLCSRTKLRRLCRQHQDPAAAILTS